MTIDRFTTLYQGDPALFLCINGSYLKFVDGQSVMDCGLENAVLISLFTREGWSGNHLFRDKKYRIGSRFEAVFDGAITLQTMIDAKDEAEKALDWMIESGLVGSIDVSVTNPTGNQIRTAIRLYPPQMPVKDLVLTKNGVNWILQIQDPAHLRG